MLRYYIVPTKTMPTAAQTSKLTKISVMMIAMTGRGSLRRYGVREWYVDALFDAFRKKDGLPSGSPTTIDEGREVAIADAFFSTTPHLMLVKEKRKSDNFVLRQSRRMIEATRSEVLWDSMARSGALSCYHEVLAG
jgi:hypothetical protein